MKGLTLLVLFVVASYAADWTVNDPEILSKQLSVENSTVRSVIQVRFSDDSPTPNTQDVQFTASGSNTMARLQQRAYAIQQTLNGHESVTLGAFSPTPPTPADQAIEDALLARRKMAALQDLKGVFGLAANAELGTSGVTVTQAENSLESDVFTDVTNAARLSILLKNIPVAVE